MFESSDPSTRTIAATDKRFFWLSLYAAPALWVGLAVLAIIRLSSVIWLSLVGEFFMPPHAYTKGPRGVTNAVGCCSYRSGSHNHEYGGFLTERQVQPGVDVCESGFWWEYREQFGRGSAGQALQVDAWL